MTELWKQAYRAEFGRDPDDEPVYSADEVTAWRAGWEAGYSAHEIWASGISAERSRLR